jgi:hypothetical protein
MSPISSSWPSPYELSLPGGHSFLIPRASDPRYLVWVFQLCFFVIGVEAGAFSKSYDALICSIAAAGLIDAMIVRYRTGKIIVPQSGFIAGTGIALLLEANQLWYYAAGATIAVLSKHLVQTEGRHSFNPSAFGALAMVVLFPLAVISNVTQWGGLTWFTLVIWTTGIVACAYSGALTTAVFWIFWFAVFAVLRAAFMHAPLLVPLGTISGPSFALFSFFMITDPRTVPERALGRCGFCFLAAAIDAFLRLQMNPYAIFWGLVSASTIYPLLLSAWLALRPGPAPSAAG